MTHDFSLPNFTSADLEHAALNRFRAHVDCLPPGCRVFREVQDQSIVLCLDFADCPSLLRETMTRFVLLQLIAHHLRLADSLKFQIDRQVMGRTTIAPSS